MCFYLQTVFEISMTSKASGSDVMKRKRQHHDDVIKRQQRTVELQRADATCAADDVTSALTDVTMAPSSETDLQDAFSAVIGRKKGVTSAGNGIPKKKRKQQETGEEDSYVSYKPKDFQTESG